MSISVYVNLGVLVSWHLGILEYWCLAVGVLLAGAWGERC